ncbi:DUF202 domain-containing protein [Pontibacter sp. E15-1]|uniref:YidH family protein n=1 Tax=Pontibacter sp. E15-1 TaxID=2919918 RepID=UPI001F4F713A|nr:DUF202 domain-containing protein [Pontibacter sp. E15-1]MCJ8165390.1 DUF202 domain-containing protein [Pontibacter sp. E15-1]
MPGSEQEEIKKLKKKLKVQERKNAEIRDQMSVQRTIFANERTLMAYLRTSIALVAGGFAALKLSHHTSLELFGVLFMLLGAALAGYGFLRYLQKQRVIKHQRRDYTHTSHRHAELHEKQASYYGNID